MRVQHEVCVFPFGSETSFFFVSPGLPTSKDQKRRWVKQATCPENEQQVLITKDTRASRSQNKNQNLLANLWLAACHYFWLGARGHGGRMPQRRSRTARLRLLVGVAAHQETENFQSNPLPK